MKHNHLYNNLLILSRNIFFYKRLNLPDNFETRIFLIFFHFSIILIIFKQKKEKFNQSHYNYLFHNIENDLREMGYGDISVNKKMKDLNKILYDILLKINISEKKKNCFEINKKIVINYLDQKKQINTKNLENIANYFNEFFNFCFDIPTNIMLKELNKFKYYGSS